MLGGTVQIEGMDALLQRQQLLLRVVEGEELSCVHTGRPCDAPDDSAGLMAVVCSP